MRRPKDLSRAFYCFLGLSGILLLAACSRSENSARNGQTGWKSNYQTLGQQVAALRRQYAKGPKAYPKTFQRLMAQMNAQWGQMQALHEQMMGLGMPDHRMTRGMGMMHRGGMMSDVKSGRAMMRFREMNQQMLSYCLALRQSLGTNQSGSAAELLDQMRSHQQQSLSQLPAAPSVKPPVPLKNASAPNGQMLYAQNCAGCHGPAGQGINGVYPPLDGSPIVQGAPERLVRIVSDGLQGPLTLGGKSFNGVMPGFRYRLDSAQMAAVLSYIRGLPQNHASSISEGTVQSEVQSTAGDQSP